MPRQVPTPPMVLMLTRKAAREMPGQTRYPRRSRAANEIPAGGHTAVALACTNANFNPSFPVMKYRMAKLMQETTSQNRRNRPWPEGLDGGLWSFSAEG